MKFSEIIEQAKALLQRQGRITYRSLKREFDLEDEALEDLKFELIDGQELAVDKDGKMLVWAGSLASSVQNPQSASRNPQSEAEACFHRAIEVARRQQAKSL
jgi:hypothetical protein